MLQLLGPECRSGCMQASAGIRCDPLAWNVLYADQPQSLSRSNGSASQGTTGRRR